MKLPVLLREPETTKVDQVGQSEDNLRMATYTIYEAKASFSKLVREAADGGDVVIVSAGRPLVKMVPVEVHKPRVFGQKLMGDFEFEPGWEEDLPHEMFSVFGDEEL